MHSCCYICISCPFKLYADRVGGYFPWGPHLNSAGGSGYLFKLTCQKLNIRMDTAKSN